MFKTDGLLVHSLDFSASQVLPKTFTYPFYYTPHPLCKLAANEVQDYLELQNTIPHNFGLNKAQTGMAIGKMFGVMIVQDANKNIGYIAAFSGKLAEKNHITGFVPPVFDTLDTSGFYKQGEAQLNQMSSQIEILENANHYNEAKRDIIQLKADFDSALNTFKRLIKTKKEERHQKRKNGQLNLSVADYNLLLERLKKESIYYHFRLKDLKLEWNTKITKAEDRLKTLAEPINVLKTKRKSLSARLQKQLHQSYQFLNYQGNTADLNTIFTASKLNEPPAGSGECAAPKLFQFAYKNQLKPIAMAEFWWGTSPKSEVRRHQQFYPSCRLKCEPILGFMMKGLSVDPNPMEQPFVYDKPLDIIYEDDYLLLVNKPHNFLSVPGKTIKDSVFERMKAYLPKASGPLLVHRLDMSTSGILLVAKNEKTHKNLQKQFIERLIKKRYVALLDGEIKEKKGIINLPLRVDFNNRPRQLVCYVHGKSAETQYEILDVQDGKTRVYFFPITGRTHQLRVHAAHHKGLNTPIVGDDLYGETSDRLCLHAAYLAFEHPVFQKQMAFSIDVPF